MQDRKSELEENKRMEVEEKCAIDRIIYNICWSTKQNQKTKLFVHETPSKQAQTNIQWLFLNQSKTMSVFLSDFIHYQAIRSFIHDELKLTRLADLKPWQSTLSLSLTLIHTQKKKVNSWESWGEVEQQRKFDEKSSKKKYDRPRVKITKKYLTELRFVYWQLLVSWFEIHNFHAMIYTSNFT